jgi:hypothetical protein
LPTCRTFYFLLTIYAEVEIAWLCK